MKRSELLIGGLYARRFRTTPESRSFDGDPRASYTLIEKGTAAIRRVEYDIEREIHAIAASGLPHKDWMIRTLRAARPQTP